MAQRKRMCDEVYAAVRRWPDTGVEWFDVKTISHARNQTEWLARESRDVRWAEIAPVARIALFEVREKMTR